MVKRTNLNAYKIIKTIEVGYRLLLILLTACLICSDFTKKIFIGWGWGQCWPVSAFGLVSSNTIDNLFYLFGCGAYFIPFPLWILSAHIFSNKKSVISSFLDYIGAFFGISAISGLCSIYMSKNRFCYPNFPIEVGGKIGGVLARTDSTFNQYVPYRVFLMMMCYLSFAALIRAASRTMPRARLQSDFWELNILKSIWSTIRGILKKLLLSFLGLAPWQKKIYNAFFEQTVPKKMPKDLYQFFGTKSEQSASESEDFGLDRPESFEPATFETHPEFDNNLPQENVFFTSVDQSMPPKPLKTHPVFKLSEYFRAHPEEKKENAFDKFEAPTEPENLIAALRDFKVEAEVEKIRLGPLVTRYELKLARGTKASKLFGINYDLARALAVPAISIGETVSGTSRINLDVANPERQLVRFTALLDTWINHAPSYTLGVILGVKSDGTPYYTDLTVMPHLLVCGMTGSGKSETLHALILSLITKYSPDELRFLFIDPKMVEFSFYEALPHLLHSIVTETLQAREAFGWCIQEMEHRYTIFQHLKVRNLEDYNALVNDAVSRGEPLEYFEEVSDESSEKRYFQIFPRIVVIVDELADLMLTVGKTIEAEIVRLVQKSRAVGIHLVLATQRPSVDILTGSLKANIPTRIALAVASKVDSRIILDAAGAETLLGRGDMFFQSTESHQLVRLHGGKVPDSLIRFVIEQCQKRFKKKVEKKASFGIKKANYSAQKNYGRERMSSDSQNDPLLSEAVSFVKMTKRASTSSLQRHLHIGYNRASRLMDQLESQGIVSAPNAVGKRKLISS